MTHFLSDDLWPAVQDAIAQQAPIHAAFAYVTAEHLPFKSGDVLVCDASEECIRSGATSAAVLRSLHDRGVRLASLPGLHAKAATIGDHVLVGSANLSSRSQHYLVEAAVLFTDPLLREQVLGFVLGLLRHSRATPIDETLLAQIERLPVERPGRGRHGLTGEPSEAAISVGPERLWVLGFTNAAVGADGSLETVTHMREAAGIPPGDWVLPVLGRHRTSSTTQARLFRQRAGSPTPILDVEPVGRGVRVRFQPARSVEPLPWNRVTSALGQAGLHQPGVVRPRLLPPQAVQALEQLDSAWFSAFEADPERPQRRRVVRRRPPQPRGRGVRE